MTIENIANNYKTSLDIIFEEWEAEAIAIRNRNEDYKTHLKRLNVLSKPCREIFIRVLEDRKKVNPNASLSAKERDEIFDICKKRIDEMIKRLENK